MKYKVGDEVVLNGHAVVLGRINAVEIIGKEGEGECEAYITDASNQRMVFNDNHIDHDRTATLNRENYAKYMEEQINDPALPVIPKFVAEWLDDNIERYKTVYSFIISLVEVFGDTVPEKVWTYASENPDIMARAYLDGYTVEEEQKYYILLPKIKRNWRYVSLRGNYDEFIDHYTDSVEDLQAFTEKEIKAVEPRYFAFAVPVEELEE